MAGIYDTARKVLNTTKSAVNTVGGLSYGKGNWLGLPELGITEMLGGNKASVKKAQAQSGSVQGLSTSNLGGSSSTRVSPNQSVVPTQSIPGNNTNTNTQTQTTPSPSKSSGSSGGSGSGVSAINPLTGEQEMYDSEGKAIDKLYGTYEDFLNNQYKSTLSGEQDYYNQATSPYEARIPELQASLTNERGEADAGILSARNDEQSALAQARRLYNELSQRNQQQFGGVGGSSAGQAVGEISAREFQRNVGSIQRQVSDTVQKLNQQYKEYETNVNAKVRELNLQKDVALSQAREMFRQRLDEINRAKVELGQNKANARLQLLQQFRQRVQSINDMVYSQQMQLQAAREQASINLSNQMALLEKQASLQNGEYDLSDIDEDALQYSDVGDTSANTQGLISGYFGTSSRNKDRYGNANLLG